MDWSVFTDWSVLKYCSILTDQSEILTDRIYCTDFGELFMGGGWVGLDYSVTSNPFLRFSMRFEFLSEMFDNSVCSVQYVRSGT